MLTGRNLTECKDLTTQVEGKNALNSCRRSRRNMPWPLQAFCIWNHLGWCIMISSFDFIFPLFPNDFNSHYSQWLFKDPLFRFQFPLFPNDLLYTKLLHCPPNDEFHHQNDKPLRCLAALADAYDEHLGIVRLTDEEAFDIVSLNRALMKFLSLQEWWYESLYIGWSTLTSTIISLNIICVQKWNNKSYYSAVDISVTVAIILLWLITSRFHKPRGTCLMRFLQTIQYMFSEGKVWEVHGTYSALMMCLICSVWGEPLSSSVWYPILSSRIGFSRVDIEQGKGH